MPTFIGTTGNDSLIGGAGADFLDARDGNDLVFGRGGSDTINTGAGSDIIAFDGDPFDGVDVSAPGRQFSGNEDFITDFSFALDSYQFDAADFRIDGALSFQALDGTAVGASIRAGTNVIVLLNGDNDANPATPPGFNAGQAATQVANLISTDGAGFFVYFNTALNMNRLVWSPNLNDPTADLKIISRHTDLLSTNAVSALANFTAANFRLAGETLTGGAGNDTLTGFGGVDTIDGGEGNDVIFGRGGQDTVTTGNGADVIGFDGDPFDGANVSAPGRQFGGNEDFITDFSFAQDAYQFDAADFRIAGGLSFQSLDGTAPGAAVRTGVNVIVLTNADDDGNTATAFNAGAAANQVANLVSSDGAGFFVYFNTALNVTRLVYSSNLNDPTADLKIVSRHTDLTGSAATGALSSFVANNFRFGGETLNGTAANDTLLGFGGADTIIGGAGNDVITGQGGSDTITTGAGADVIAFDGPVFDGVNVSAPGRQFSGNEDFITDFDFAQDSYRLDAADFGITSALSFQALDGTAPGAAIRPGANVIVLLNGDNDANPATPPGFNAGQAATQVASLVSTDGAGFFVYFNTALNVNRLVYSPNLNDPNADLKIVSRHTDLTGADAIAALARFTEANFRFGGETVSGTAANDTLQGTIGDDVILGNAGNDTLVGNAGNDLLDGGAGTDTARYSGAIGSYSVSSTRVSSASEGTDTLSSIERLSFSDSQVFFDSNDVAAQVFRLYDAAFDRRPDAGGFSLYVDFLQTGGTLAQLSQVFSGSAEFQARFGALDNLGFVQALYRVSLNREGEAAGVAFHVAALNAGASRGALLSTFAESPEHRGITSAAEAAGLVVAQARAAASSSPGEDLSAGDTFVLPALNDGGDKLAIDLEDGLAELDQFEFLTDFQPANDRTMAILPFSDGLDDGLLPWAGVDPATHWFH